MLTQSEIHFPKLYNAIHRLVVLPLSPSLYLESAYYVPEAVKGAEVATINQTKEMTTLLLWSLTLRIGAEMGS